MALCEGTHDVDEITPSGPRVALELRIERFTAVVASRLSRDVEEKAPKVRSGIADAGFESVEHGNTHDAKIRKPYEAEIYRKPPKVKRNKYREVTKENW